MPKGFFRIYHLLFGLFDLIAIIFAFYYSLNVLSIFFSYFTVLSNILATFVFLYFGLGLKKNNLINKLYGPSVLYMTITGVIFWTILRNHHLVATVPWITMVMHGVMPIIVFLGWILFRPKIKLDYKDALVWQIFPLLFVIYTLIRGPFAHWYPYFFLNPEKAGGYTGVSLYVAFILFGSWLAALFLVWLAKIRKT